MTILVILPGQGSIITYESYPCPFRVEHEIQAANTDESRAIPNCATFMRLFTSAAAGAHYAVDLVTEGGDTGDGLVLRADTERGHVLPPGVQRNLHLRSATLGAVVACEFH